MFSSQTVRRFANEILPLPLLIPSPLRFLRENYSGFNRLVVLKMDDMDITREQTAGKLRAYLEHDLPLDSLVDWAESAMNDGQFSDVHHDAIRDVVARLGVADVRAFGLTWEDCEQLLRKLGYTARVSIASV